MSPEESEPAEVLRSQARLQAYQAVRAVLSDDHNYDQGVEGARAVADAAYAEAGAAGSAEVVVELTLKLAEALERIAADQGLTALDLTDVWFME